MVLLLLHCFDPVNMPLTKIPVDDGVFLLIMKKKVYTFFFISSCMLTHARVESFFPDNITCSACEDNAITSSLHGRVKESF